MTLFSKANFVELFDNFRLGVMAIDENGIVVYYNQAISEIDGLEPEFVLGMDMIHAYGPEPYPSPMMTCLHTGKPIVGFVLSYTTVRGRHVSIEQDAYPLRQGKKITGVIAFIRHYPKLSVAPPPVVSTVDEIQDPHFVVHFDNLVGNSSGFIEAVEIGRKAALTPSSILLVGKTGTGKELFARSIHSASPRNDKPFVGVNCSAVPATLLESVLFGTVKGAFTDAQDRDGLFTEAKGGTIFLDELDSMPLHLQPKLLRALQEKKIRRIGSNIEEDIDVKIISSVATSPEQLLSEKRLRSDLYYRLGVVIIQIPPLKERLDDMDALCNYFIIKHNSRLGKTVKAVSPAVMDLFQQYEWPGNVRELEHVIEGAMNLIYDEETLTPSMLPHFFFRSMNFDETRQEAMHMTGSVPITTPTRKKEIPEIQKTLREEVRWHKDAELDLLKQALSKTFGNVTAAAALLGMSSQNLSYKMKKYNLSRNDFKQYS